MLLRVLRCAEMMEKEVILAPLSRSHAGLYM